LATLNFATCGDHLRKRCSSAAICGLTIAPVAFLKVLFIDRMLWVTEVDGNPVNG
jgi:hypothetical protein